MKQKKSEKKWMILRNKMANCEGTTEIWSKILYKQCEINKNSSVHIGLFHYIKVDTPISIALGYLMWHNSRLTEFCL